MDDETFERLVERVTERVLATLKPLLPPTADELAWLVRERIAQQLAPTAEETP